MRLTKIIFDIYILGNLYMYVLYISILCILKRVPKSIICINILQTSYFQADGFSVQTAGIAATVMGRADETRMFVME